MSKIIKLVICASVVLFGLLFLKNIYRENKLTLKDVNLTANVKFKGVKDTRDFAIDDKGNFYIAFKDKIQYIEKNGRSFDVLNDKTLNISSLEYYSGKLYYVSNTKVTCFDIKTKECKEMIKDLPNFGDYRDSLIKIRNHNLYITIGAATNSGVVGRDNEWIQENPYNHDISPKDVTIKGKSFGEEKTGAFASYRTKNVIGQLIPAHFPGNSSIIKIDLASGNSETFAWGIRNISGLDFSSEGRLIGVVGGMEDRGLRPIKGDSDYIYEIKRGYWYGWPDYSGGDPVTSPKFRNQNNERASFLLDNHPNRNPPGPIYQHKNLSALGTLAVDSSCAIGEKDCIYFYDKADNIIYSLSKNNVLSEKASGSEKNSISSMKFLNNSLYILDSKEGSLYSVYSKPINGASNLNKNVVFILLGLILVGVLLLMWKYTNDNQKISNR